MVHFHMEIIMPPTKNPEAAARELMEPFRRTFPDADRAAFCDYFTIGGYPDRKGRQGNLVTLGKCPKDETAYAVLIAKPTPEGLYPLYMVRQQVYNGVTLQDTAWDHTIGGALNGCAEQYPNTPPPQDNWLVVAVDYHD